MKVAAVVRFRPPRCKAISIYSGELTCVSIVSVRMLENKNLLLIDSEDADAAAFLFPDDNRVLVLASARPLQEAFGELL